MIKFTVRFFIVAGIILLTLYFFRFSIKQGGLDVDFRGKARVENLRRITNKLKQKALSRLVGKESEEKVSSEKAKESSKSTDEQISEEDRRALEKIIEEKY